MLNPRKSNPSLRWTILVLASLKATPRGCSHPASRALTCSACAREAHKTARSSAYAEDRVMPIGWAGALVSGWCVVPGLA